MLYFLYQLRFESLGNDPGSLRTEKFLEEVVGANVTPNQHTNGARLWCRFARQRGRVSEIFVGILGYLSFD